MLLTGRDLTKSFGPRLLFSGITLGLEAGERVGLIGANGSGKSTLLRVFAGLEAPDDGRLDARRNLRVGYVAQDEQFPADATCHSVVEAQIDRHLDAHDRDIKAQILLDKAGFPDFHAQADTLSGGWRKRLSIVRQLARDPELMLFDEPTNHLDVEGILWLEDLIDAAPFATLTVSHDRRFLEEVATRIIELGKQYPDGYLSIEGTYTDFVEKRATFMEAQAGRQTAVASLVRKEIAWLRRGAKARTTKSKGRIERAGDLMTDLADLKNRNAKVAAASVDFTASQRQTRKLIELKKVTKALGGRKLFSALDLVLGPGTKLGLLGPNGSGKSTLLKIITDQLSPDAGTVVRAGQLQIVLFDQHREQLDDALTLREALLPAGGDSVNFNGVLQHVTGWAQRFRFRTEQLDLPLSQLSGGEKARVLIARLMLKPADVLILDEPTNDLDLDTLDVLETSLEEFAGAIILVTHDRYLLDRLATDILALDGLGSARLFADLSQWETAFIANAKEVAAARRAAAKPGVKSNPVVAAKKKLSWNDQKELDAMEEAIQIAESNVERLQAVADDAAVLADHVKSRDAFAALGEANEEVNRLYARWTELEAKKK